MKYISSIIILLMTVFAGNSSAYNEAEKHFSTSACDFCSAQKTATYQTYFIVHDNSCNDGTGTQSPLEDMLAEKGLRIQGNKVYSGEPMYAMAGDPQDRGLFQDRVSNSDIIFGNDLELSIAATKLENGEAFSSSDYYTALNGIFKYDLTDPRFELSMKILQGTNVDSLLDEKPLEQKVSYYKKAIDAEKRATPPDPKKMIDYYKKLIDLEPNNFDNYEGILDVNQEYYRNQRKAFKTENLLLLSDKEVIHYTKQAMKTMPDIEKDEKIRIIDRWANQLFSFYLNASANKKFIELIIDM